MKAEYINPFLESAGLVLEQLTRVRPVTGPLGIQDVHFAENHIWIKIGLDGEMIGDVVFGLHEEVALKLASAMMGGYAVTQVDDMTRSAISELGNMISGNASILLYNQGIKVGITPPVLIQSSSDVAGYRKKALTIPLHLDQIGQMEIKVLVS